MALAKQHPVDLVEALRGGSVRIIAEVKKASPSRGLICRDFNPAEIARAYVRNGAAAISVLTENKFFQGSLDHLSIIDSVLGPTRPPLLRKDFIFDPYQVYESRAYGADALLLIVAILTFEKLQELLDLSHHLQLRCLVEIHNEDEAKIAIDSSAAVIGINNRDLKTFNVDINTTERLRLMIPDDRVVVSESGIKGHNDILKLRNWGVNAALIGETLMTAKDVGSKMRELL
jgi:indole-3-glycerol phosphate synthase